MRSGLLAAACLAAAFSSTARADGPTVKQIERARVFPPVAPQTVKVLFLGQDDAKLPEAITVAPSGFGVAGRIHVAAEAKSAPDPTLVIAEYTMRRPPGADPAPLITAIVDAAARAGVNALVVDVKARTVEAAGLHLAAAATAPTGPPRPAAALLREEAKRLEAKGYRPAGAPETRSLAAFAPLVLAAKRGTCYWISFALDEKARLSPHARQGLAFQFQAADGDIAHAAGTISLAGRAGDGPVGCPQVPGEIRVDLVATRGMALSKQKIHDLGDGEVVFQVLTRAVTEKELGDRARTSKAAWERAADADRRQAAKACGECQHLLDGCGREDPRDCRAYNECLSRRAARVEECLAK